jgi:S1-C subfamily serine protease
LGQSRLLSWLIPVLCVLLGFAIYRIWIDRGRVSFTPRAITPRGDLAADEKAQIALFKANSPSVVYITTLRQARDFRTLTPLEIPEGTGSGFVWDDAGDIVTNFHVIQSAIAHNGSATVTLWDHSTYDAQLVGIAQNYDLAVLRITAPASRLRPIPIGESKNLQVGQKVFAIGNPFGLDQSLTTGVVSALGRTIPAMTRRPIEDVIQTDAAINPGNSGGPLLDSAGRLIGINTAIYSPSGTSAGIGFAIPVDTINRIIPELLASGRVTRPTLGIQFYDTISRTIIEALQAQGADVQGAVVMGVDPNSPAARAGIKPMQQVPDGKFIVGDVIVQADGKPVSTRDQMYAILEKHNAGDEIALVLWRAGKTREVKIKLDPPKQ